MDLFKNIGSGRENSQAIEVTLLVNTPGDISLPGLVSRVVDKLGGHGPEVVYMQASRVREGVFSVRLYVTSNDPSKLERELSRVEGVEEVRVEPAEADPLIAVIRGGVDKMIPLTPALLSTAYSILERVLGRVGASVLSYHMASALGRGLMDLVTSVGKKPGGLDEAIRYSEKLLSKTGMGELKVVKVRDKPLVLRALVKNPPSEEANEHLLKGIVVGSLSQAVGKPLRTLETKRDKNEMEILVSESRRIDPADLMPL